MSEFEYNDNLVPCSGNDYDSAFETDGEKGKKPPTREFVAAHASSSSSSSANAVRLKDVKEHAQQEYLREARRQERQTVRVLDAYSRHKKLINDYFLCYKGQAEKLRRDCSKDRTDADVLRDNHRFVWDDVDESQLSWEQRLAKKYYDRLFKEYCITDLRFYKQQKIAFRWRTEQEVVVGKGQFSCGEKHCRSDTDLRSWEVNFAYVEQGERKNALVKVRVCESCSRKLNFGKQRREVTRTPAANADADTSKRSKGDRSENRRKRRASPKNAAGGKRDKKKRARRKDGDRSNSSASSSSSEEEEEVCVKVLEEKRFDDGVEENPWAKPIQTEDEPNIDDEFDSFLDDMLL